eukprot:gnl/TRDRNA2_/TRDRNA2_86180_c1_seq1.p1 gnl/TRDRNA2_/TRDRNA2_86180_c1~~gnl/TRDRNA2_/TRDRNA2_86180_c1_seq1.p1  ORF type:complete len:937 (+),score=197.13 gnl/TRDRNA2_/TRDRNA2_86180_c1_seq1:260-2812(+)
MQPLDEESGMYEIAIEPGEIVFIRMDQLTHEYTSETDTGYCLSCYFFESANRPAQREKPGFASTPTALYLEAYLMDRLQKIMDDPKRGTLPRCVEETMNRLFTAKDAQHTNIRGYGLDMPAVCEFRANWAAFTAGLDPHVYVPSKRWDHHPHYDGSDPEKVCSKHGAFMEGIEMFDNKFFGINETEARGMGPDQCQGLQMAYTILYNGGRRKKDLLKSNVGVYVGNAPQEWLIMERDKSTYTGIGGDNALVCGRISYILGLTGPCLSFDAENAAGMSAVNQAVEALHHFPRDVESCLAIGEYYMLSYIPWYMMSRMKMMGPSGRCFVFDESANGFSKGEGNGGVYLELPLENEDAEKQINHGTIVASSIKHQGLVSHMGAPHAPSQRDLMFDCIKKSHIAALDVDAVDCFGKSMLLHDAVEHTTTARVYRGKDKENEAAPLVLSSTRTNFGVQQAASGIASIMKALMQGQWGASAPLLHLYKLNPHLDDDDSRVVPRHTLISNEPLGYKMDSSFLAFSAHGWGGTNGHMIMFNPIHEDKMEMPKQPFKHKLVHFWPGGGGFLRDEQHAQKAYTIVGSWSCYEPEKMENEAEGVYGFDVVMGENNFENFRILLDGDEEKVLHPGMFKAIQGVAVVGPSSGEESLGCNWIIDGRSEVVMTPRSTSSAEDTEERKAKVEYEATNLKTEDTCEPGQQYRIYLRINGKYRTVDWEKVFPEESDAEGWSTEPPPQAIPGKYFIVGSWNDWAYEPMELDESESGKFVYKVKIDRYTKLMKGYRFQIVRNKDWCQTFYPETAAGFSGSTVAGPDDSLAATNAWNIAGEPGDVFEITLVRRVSPKSDVKLVSWSNVGAE